MKFQELPVIVRTCIIILQRLAKIRTEERGYSIYFRGDDYIVIEDYGQGLLTISGFAVMDKFPEEWLPFLVRPTAVYNLHTHPFENYPKPSELDKNSAKLFRDYYSCPVHFAVIGKKGIKWF